MNDDGLPPSSDADGVRRTTLRQVAKVAGVSAMTVSRALRNHGRVDPELGERVRRIAQTLGYRPDPRIANLMSHLRQRDKVGYTASIAGITSISEASETIQVRRARESVRRRAEELGFRLEVFRVEQPEIHNPALERTLINRGIEGVVLLRMRSPVRVDLMLDWTRFSAVQATPSVLSPCFARVEPNHFHNARIICEQLARLGRRRIGFIGTQTYCVRTHHAFIAALAWQGTVNGEPPLKALVFPTQAIDFPAIKAWFAKERPDAIVLYYHEHARRVAEELGLSVDGPVLLVCTDVDPLNITSPGIDERQDIVGRKSIELLVGMLNRNEKGPSSVRVSTMIEGTWIEPAPHAPARPVTGR